MHELLKPVSFCWTVLFCIITNRWLMVVSGLFGALFGKLVNFISINEWELWWFFKLLWQVCIVCHMLEFSSGTCFAKSVCSLQISTKNSLFLASFLSLLSPSMCLLGFSLTFNWTCPGFFLSQRYCLIAPIDKCLKVALQQFSDYY